MVGLFGFHFDTSKPPAGSLGGTFSLFALPGRVTVEIPRVGFEPTLTQACREHD